LEHPAGKMKGDYNMISHEFIMSSCYGVIEDILIQIHSQIYEGKPLFTIRNSEGNIETVRVKLSGKVHSLEVQKGDRVIPGMVLAFVKEDSFLIENQ
jgi:biotin carboxyl carrier protein